MMSKNKILSILCTAAMMVSIAGCSSGGTSSGAQSGVESQQPGTVEAEQSAQPEAKVPVRVGMLKGPTGMGMAGLMQSAEDGTAVNDYDFIMKEAPTDIRAMLMNDELDIAALPTNMAAVLYNKNDKSVTMLAVNTLGVLYVMQNGGEISTIADLKGKTLHSTGQASVPEYVLNHILTKNNLNPATDVDIVYDAEHAALATQMAAGDVKLGMLPEPFVTITHTKNEEVTVALDMTAEWDKVSDGALLAMGCIVVRSEFLKENKDAVDAFLDEYQQSVAFVNRDIGEAAAVMDKFGVITGPVAEKAIPNCNIVYEDGADMIAAVQGFLQVLYEADPASVGESIPDDAFYYQK